MILLEMNGFEYSFWNHEYLEKDRWISGGLDLHSFQASWVLSLDKED